MKQECTELLTAAATMPLILVASFSARYGGDFCALGYSTDLAHSDGRSPPTLESLSPASINARMATPDCRGHVRDLLKH